MMMKIIIEIKKGDMKEIKSMKKLKINKPNVILYHNKKEF